MFIKDNCAWINIDIACRILELSRSAYYEWLAKEDKYLQQAKEDQQLTQQIITMFNKYKKRYGTRRIMQKLRDAGVMCSYKKVATIMHDNNLYPNSHKKYKVTTTNSKHKHKVFANLLERNFTVDKPNHVFVGDITYIKTDEGWLYLATVIDLFSRKLIGYKMSNRMTKDLVISALQMALKNRDYPKNVIIHSDRGSQYASNEYKQLLQQHQLLGSMSKKGDC